MQRKNIETLKANLLSNLDDDCNVINVEGALAAVNDLLEHPTTQEELEQTRLGKYVNEFRKKTSHIELSKKAKELLKNYQAVVNQAAGNLLKKDVLQIKNGTHVTVPVPHQNYSKVNDKGPLNGKIKNPPHPSSDKTREKLSQTEPRNIPTCSSNNSQHGATTLRNGVPPAGEDNFKKNVNTQEFSKKAAVLHSDSKNSSVINGNNSPHVLNPRKVACDTVSATGKKRHLDVPSVNADHATTKRAKFDNSLPPSESLSSAKGKLLNGTVNNIAAESKVFSCKVSPDLKCTIRSEAVRPVTVSSPSLSIKSSSSKQDLNKPDIVNKPRKVETTEQLIQKLRLNGELCSMPSQTIYKLKSQIVKEEPEEMTVVPDEVKPKSHKKRSRLQPPSETSDLNEVKKELIQRYLHTPANSSNSTPISERPEPVAECLAKTSISIDISKLDPASEEYTKELLRNPLAFLAPIPDEEIICDHEKESHVVPDTSSETLDKLFNCHWSGMNGQYDLKNEWRSFDQAYSIKNPYTNTFLNILPYVCLN